MATFDDREMAVARVYARAMLEIAREGDPGELLEELQGMVSLFETHPELKDFLTSPLVDQGPRKKVLDGLFRERASALFLDSLQVINQNSRLALLPCVAEAYRLDYDALRGVVDVEVHSAIELTEGQREALRGKVQALTGKTPKLVETVNPQIVGGLIVQVGDDRLDGSVATQLQVAGAKLKQRAAREIRSEKSYWA